VDGTRTRIDYLLFEPVDTAVSNEVTTWGTIKALFR
jgi:hypothetical protein